MHIMSDHYVKVKVQLEQLKCAGVVVGDTETAEEQEQQQLQVVTDAPPLQPPQSPIHVSLHVRRDTSKCLATARTRSKSRTKYGSYDRSVTTRDASAAGQRLDNAPSLQIKGTGKVLQEKAEANGNVAAGDHTLKDTTSARSRDDANANNKPVKKRRPVTVDTSKAKTSLEALKISIRHLKWKEVGYADCDVGLSNQTHLHL